MAWLNSLWQLWLYSALASGVILAIAAVAVRSIRQPVRQLRIMELALASIAILPLVHVMVVLSPIGPRWHVAWLTRATPIEPSPALRADRQDDSTSAESESQWLANEPPPPPISSELVDLAGTDAFTNDDVAVANVAIEPQSTRAMLWDAIPRFVLATYAVIVAILAMRWVAASARLARLRRVARHADERVQSMLHAVAGTTCDNVDLRVSDHVEQPITFGLFRPTILIPARLTENESCAPLRYALAHEWSHIERRDLWTLHLALVAQVLFFYQPLVWWMQRQVRLCQDYLADARAAGQARHTEDYADFLVKVALSRFPTPSVSALSFGDRRSNLGRRVRMLVQHGHPLDRRCRAIWSMATAVVAVLLIGCLSIIRLEAGDPLPVPKATGQTVPDEQASNASAATEVADPQTKKGPARAKHKERVGVRLEYTGHVVAKGTDRPIEGARVTVRRVRFTAKQGTTLEESHHVTDADGQYTFVIPPEQSKFNVVLVTVEVEHDEFVHFSESVRLSSIQKGEVTRPFFERIALEQGEPVSLAVETPDGAPAANVPVISFSRPAPVEGERYQFGSFSRTMADARGRITMRISDTADTALWIVPKDASLETYIVTKRGELGTLRLRHGVVIQGHVLDARGAPLNGVWVEATRVLEEDEVGEFLGRLGVGDQTRRAARTDGKGNFVLAPLPAGTYRVSVIERNADPITHEFQNVALNAVFLTQTVEVTEESPPAAIELRAHPHVLVDGTMLRPDGRPLAGYRWSLIGQFDGQPYYAATMPDGVGNFQVIVPHGLEKARLSLGVGNGAVIRHRLSKDAPLSNRQAIEFGTLDHDVRGIELVLFTCPTLFVDAVDENGDDIKDYVVKAEYAADRAPREQKRVLADGVESDVNFERQEDGRYRAQDLLPDEEIVVTVIADGYLEGKSRLSLPERASTELDVRLIKASSDARVDVDGNSKEPGQAVESIADVAGGEPLAAAVQSSPPRSTPPAPVPSLPEGGGETLTYYCRVTEKGTDKPIGGARIAVRRSRNSATEDILVDESHHVTDDDGKYTIVIPPEQSKVASLYIELDVEHDDYMPQTGFGYALSMIRKNEKLGGRPFFERVQLEPGELITARVEAPDGTPAIGVGVLTFSRPRRSRDEGAFIMGSFGRVRTDVNGSFRAPVATPGDAAFWILPDDAAPQVHLVDARGDQGTLRLEPGFVLTGQVLDASGAPMSGVWVEASREGTDSEVDQALNQMAVSDAIGRYALTDGQGKFTMAPLPSARYGLTPQDHGRLTFSGEFDRRPLGAVFVSRPVDIEMDSAPSPIVLRAEPHVVVEVQFYNSQGDVSAGHAPFLFGRFDGKSYHVRAQPGGKGRFTLLAPHGLEQAKLDLMTNEHGALRWRLNKNAPLVNQREIELGAIEQDIREIEVVRYVAPILLVRAVDDKGNTISNFRVSAAYPAGKGRYNSNRQLILSGGVRSDVSFERQEDGRYRSEQLFPDEEVTITVIADGYEQGETKVSLPERATKDLDIVLKRSQP